MKLRLALKIRTRINENRWPETTLARVVRRIAKTASQKDAEAFMRDLMTPRNLFWYDGRKTVQAIEALGVKWDQVQHAYTD